MSMIETAPEKISADHHSFQTERVITISLGHLLHDTAFAFLGPLLPLIQNKLQINYSAAGGLASLAFLGGALNPIVGLFADRFDLRWFIILAPATTATLMSCIGLAPSYTILAILLLLAGFSSSCYHAPAPAAIAELSGKRIGLGMSIFMAGGELGRTIGPLFVVFAVGYFSLEGLWRVMFIGWALSLLLYWRLHGVKLRSTPLDRHALGDFWQKGRRFFPFIAFIIFARSLLLTGITTFLPTYLIDIRAIPFEFAGRSLSIVEGAGVIGTLLSGPLSDRWGRKRILYLLFSLSPLAALVLFQTESTWLWPKLLAVGFLSISPTPVLLAVTQDEFPRMRSLANGLTIAFNFVMLALAGVIFGRWADSRGLQTSMVMAAVFALVTVVGVWFLPLTSHQTKGV